MRYDAEDDAYFEEEEEPEPKASKPAPVPAYAAVGLLTGAELVEAVAEDLVCVLLVQRARDVRLGGNGPFNAAGTTYGRNCGQIFVPR